MISRIALASVFLLSMSSARAELIDYDAFTYDDVSNLSWLDLSYTGNMSMVGALDQYDGWRFATNSEIDDLFAQSFDGFYNTVAIAGSDASWSNGGAYAGQNADVAVFQSLFGLSREAGSNSIFAFSYGLYLDEDGIVRSMGAAYHPSQNYTIVVGTEHYAAYPDNYQYYSDPSYGVFLVQSGVVPVPPAAWLFGSALAGLGWLRRRQTA